MNTFTLMLDFMSVYSRTKSMSKYQHKTTVTYTHSKQHVSITHLYECFKTKFI